MPGLPNTTSNDNREKYTTNTTTLHTSNSYNAQITTNRVTPIQQSLRRSMPVELNNPISRPGKIITGSGPINDTNKMLSIRKELQTPSKNLSSMPMAHTSEVNQNILSNSSNRRQSLKPLSSSRLSLAGNTFSVTRQQSLLARYGTTYYIVMYYTVLLYIVIIYRRSSIYISSTSSEKISSYRDPRETTKKEYQQHAIRIIYEYLIENLYDKQNFTIRVLQSPTSKDFRNIFIFLVQKIDTNFILSERQYEEEIRSILRLLGYPITVHRTTLQSIGSPHSLPALLGILEWLINMITLMSTTLDSDPSLWYVIGIFIVKKKKKNHTSIFYFTVSPYVRIIENFLRRRYQTVAFLNICRYFIITGCLEKAMKYNQNQIY